MAFLRPPEPASPSRSLKAHPQKEYMTQPVMTSFTEKGQLKHTLAAEHWEYKAETHLSKLMTPQTTVFKPKNILNQNEATQKKQNTPEEPPITISSDSAEFDDKKGIATYRQHVTLDQGNRHLRADTLTIERNKSGNIAKITALGNPAHFEIQAHPTRPVIRGHANTIHYFPEEEKILLIDNAELTQQGNIIRGSYLSYLLKSEVLSSEAQPGKRTQVIIPRLPKGQNK
jgi:lipopolysaccharide export system protein LptA